MSSWKRNAQVFRSMPLRSLLYYFGAVLLLFAALGAANSILSIDHFDVPHLVWTVLFTSVFSVCWAWFGSMRMHRSMGVLGVLQFMAIALAIKYFPAPASHLTREQLSLVVNVHGLLIVSFITLGYVLMVAFIRTEGSRFFEAHTEIKLASTIQRDLVPVIALRNKRFEAYGVSLPSGEVGGDLVDVVEHGSSSLAYIADVSGHGVKAGVFMSMIKASVRMRYAGSNLNEGGLLESLNEVLTPLTDAQSYVTFAYLDIPKQGPLTFSLAGHLPIFLWQQKTGVVQQHSVENVPVGMFARRTFATSSLEVEPGDVLALITDGLTEVFDRNDNELGYGYIEQMLKKSRQQPLHDLATDILKACEQFGKQTDDRTLLLVRMI